MASGGWVLEKKRVEEGRRERGERDKEVYDKEVWKRDVIQFLDNSFSPWIFRFLRVASYIAALNAN